MAKSAGRHIALPYNGMLRQTALKPALQKAKCNLDEGKRDDGLAVLLPGPELPLLDRFDRAFV
jgi:hypothetical protein